MSEWRAAAKVADYRSRAADIPHRLEGEAVVIEVLPERVERVLDVGCGDGRLLGLVRTARPDAVGVGLDFSPPMLEAARERFDGAGVEVAEHDLTEPLPALGSFDLVVSSFAIHHLEHDRKRELYGEILALLEPSGVFCNLEHVSSPTQALHREFLALLGVPEDPLEQAARGRDPAALAARGRLRERGLPLEVAGAGAALRRQARLIGSRSCAAVQSRIVCATRAGSSHIGVWPTAGSSRHSAARKTCE